MKNNGNLIDTSLRDLITGHLGGDEAKIMLGVMETYMLENNVVTAPPLMGDGNTKGDWRINLTMPDGQKQDIRPDNALSYTIIREMLKSGPIRFALEMKRAQMVSVFRNRRSVSAYCKNEEMQQVTEFVIEHVLPFAAFEFTWSALVYGSAFMEQVWETKTLSQLGLDGSKYYTIPKQLNLVPHETIRHIKRTNQGDFDGFIQMADYKLGNYYIISTPNVNAFAPGDVNVSMQDSLVIPYNGFSRNLWGESFLLPLYPLWFWYEIIIRCLVRYSELMGDPPRLGKAPSRKKVRLSPTSTDLVDAIDYLLALAVNLTKSNAVVIPSDVDEQGRPEWELGYMQTPDRSQPFVQIIELFNQMILRSALSGDRAFTQVAGAAGSNALGEVHAEATALHNEMVVSSWLHYLNRYWISNISKFNLGVDGVPVWLEVQGLDPREREFLTSIAGIAGNSSTFQEFFYMVDWEQLGKMAGMPMLSKEQAAQLKADIAKQAQDQKVEETLTQQDLDIEGTKKQVKIEKELGLVPPPAPPTDLEVQRQLEKLTHGEVPIFFSQTEIKNLFGEKETAPPQNFFIPSKPYSKDLASAIALAYKYQTIQLFNPLHDNLGRFASKQGSAQTYITNNKSDILATFATAGVSSLLPSKKQRVQTELEHKLGVLSAQEYQKRYNRMSFGQKLVTTPAEYLSRKNGLMPKVARLAVEVGPDVAFSFMLGAGIFSKASVLGATATAAASLALFGAAPAAAVTIGGILVGAGAVLIASELVDYSGTKITRAYLNRYVPQDPYHLSFTQASGGKKAWKTTKVAAQVYGTGVNLLANVVWYGFGAYTGVPAQLEEQIEDVHEFLAALNPYVAGMLMGKVAQIEVPYDDQLQYIPGFYVQGNTLVMTPQTLLEYIEAYEKGEMPEIQTIEFGDVSVEVDPTRLENIQLFNPAHDAQGRFASKTGFALLGGSLDPKRTPKPLQAQRSANKVTLAMGRTFKSGLVKGLKVKVCGDWDCMKKETGLSANALGAYHQGKLVLSPHGLAYSAYDNPKFFNRIVAHEATHARRRSGGGGIEFFSKNQVDLEEGCTELLSMGKTKYPFNKSPYLKQMQSVAYAARRASHQDKDRAWKIVSSLHFYNDVDDGLAAYRAYAGSDKFNKGSNADVEWLMGSMPTQLELDEDEKQFAASEKEIYKTLRKVRHQTFPAAKPFEEDEL